MHDQTQKNIKKVLIYNCKKTDLNINNSHFIRFNYFQT